MAVEAQRAEPSPPKAKGKPLNNVPKIDQELRAAKTGAKLVTLVLSTFVDGVTDEDCVVCGYVVYVDKYDLKLRIHVGLGDPNEIWFKRSAIITTEIAR